MKPGPEMDATVCVALGIAPVEWQVRQSYMMVLFETSASAEEHVRRFGGDITIVYPPVSTDIAAAWLVVEALRAKGWRYLIRDDYAEENVVFWKQHHEDGGWHAAEALPEAICRACLKALGVAESEGE